MTERDPATELAVVNTFIDHDVAGILISPSDPEGAASRLAIDLQVPFVEMLNRSAEVSCDVFEADNAGGGRIATQHLIECGHRDIGFVAGIPNSTGRNRYAGFRAALEGAGVTVAAELVVRGDYTRSGGQTSLADAPRTHDVAPCALVIRRSTGGLHTPALGVMKTADGTPRM